MERGWHAHVLGEAPHTFTDPVEAVKTLRVRHVWDNHTLFICKDLAGDFWRMSTCFV